MKEKGFDSHVMRKEKQITNDDGNLSLHFIINYHDNIDLKETTNDFESYLIIDHQIIKSEKTPKKNFESRKKMQSKKKLQHKLQGSFSCKTLILLNNCKLLENVFLFSITIDGLPLNKIKMKRHKYTNFFF